MHSELDDNFIAVNNKIKRAIHNANREDESVKLVAVTKRQPKEKIKFFLDKGIKIFGENRVQDAINRWTNIDRTNIEIHMIGPLQTNKSEEAIKFFDVIETLDRDKLANALSKSEYKLNKKLKYFVQINTGEEKQKSGIIPQEAEGFINRCKLKYGLKILGLMCIPPIDQNPGIHFAFLREISKRNKLEYLSMGMSNDFEDAILFGSTHLRIGTALFGKRLEKEKINWVYKEWPNNFFLTSI